MAHHNKFAQIYDLASHFASDNDIKHEYGDRTRDLPDYMALVMLRTEAIIAKVAHGFDTSADDQEVVAFVKPLIDNLKGTLTMRGYVNATLSICHNRRSQSSTDQRQSLTFEELLNTVLQIAKK